MAITTNLKILQRAGLATQVIDENVGTGDNSETDYDLDNDKVIAGSYTLSYAASGSNNFTALTETTHYTLDKDSGRILLEAAGVTALGTNVLYATYWHLPEDTPLSDSVVSNYLTIAEERLREITGRVWSSTQITEFHDGHRMDQYPHTDAPFSTQRQRYDSIILEEYPVTSIDEVWFLDRTNNTFSEVLVSDGGSFTDEQSDAEDPGTSFYVFAAVPAVNDAMYLGLDYKFTSIFTKLQTLGTDAGSLAVTWEYYNGSSWASLSNVSASATNGDLFLANSKLSWDMPTDWEETTVSTGGSMYYVRARMSAGSYTNVPKLWEVYPNTDEVLMNHISPREVQFTREGRITFITESVPDGVKNIRIKYTAGMTSSDKDYNLGIDLANAIGALMSHVTSTGGSFDDETSFTLGSKAVTVGEVYVNVAEVVRQLKEEIKDLISLLGRRADMGGE